MQLFVEFGTINSKIKLSVTFNTNKTQKNRNFKLTTVMEEQIICNKNNNNKNK